MNNGVLERELIIPNPREFCTAWNAFFLTVSAIATYRAKAYGPYRFGELSNYAANLLVEASNSNELQSSISQMAEDPHEKIVLGILFEELLFVSWKYQKAFELAGIETPEMIFSLEAPQFSNESGHPDDPDTLENIETVKGSIQPLLDKLHPWIRKGIEAIMEVLKLTRGSVD